MTCVFCQKHFRMVEGEKTCRGCSLFGGCQKVKCPYCHYEMPREISLWGQTPSQKMKEQLLRLVTLIRGIRPPWRGFLGRLLS